jgi:hypothetical protein
VNAHNEKNSKMNEKTSMGICPVLSHACQDIKEAQDTMAEMDVCIWSL